MPLDGRRIVNMPPDTFIDNDWINHLFEDCIIALLIIRSPLLYDLRESIILSFKLNWYPMGAGFHHMRTTKL